MCAVFNKLAAFSAILPEPLMTTLSPQLRMMWPDKHQGKGQVRQCSPDEAFGTHKHEKPGSGILREKLFAETVEPDAGLVGGDM